MNNFVIDDLPLLMYTTRAKDFFVKFVESSIVLDVVDPNIGGKGRMEGFNTIHMLAMANNFNMMHKFLE